MRNVEPRGRWTSRRKPWRCEARRPPYKLNTTSSGAALDPDVTGKCPRLP